MQDGNDYATLVVQHHVSRPKSVWNWNMQNYAAGPNDLRSQFSGSYATWHDDGGTYVDTVLQAGHLRYTACPSLASSAEGKGSSVLASIEVGPALQVAPGWTAGPQVPLASQHMNLDDLTLAAATLAVGTTLQITPLVAAYGELGHL